MTEFLKDEEKFRSFLRRYRPFPPPAKAGSEKQLLQLLGEQTNSGKKRQRSLLWAIPSALVASLLLAWGGYRWLQPSPPIASESAELEAFLLDSWNESIGETPLPSGSSNLEAGWLLLSDPDSDSHPYQP